MDFGLAQIEAETDQDILAFITYIADEDKLEKILENPQVMKTPVVRNAKQFSVKI